MENQTDPREMPRHDADDMCPGCAAHEDRISKMERFVNFIAEKTGVHFNKDEFEARENIRAN